MKRFIWGFLRPSAFFVPALALSDFLSVGSTTSKAATLGCLIGWIAGIVCLGFDKHVKLYPYGSDVPR